LNKSIFSSFFCFPITSLLAFLILFLLAYNSLTTFLYFIPQFTIEIPTQTHHQKNKISNVQFYSSKPINAIKEKTHILLSNKTHLTFLNSNNLTRENNPKIRKPNRVLKTLPSSTSSKEFSSQVKQFFVENSCEIRVFMTWISPLVSFGDREKFCIESLFKFNPNACLLIVSNSMDTYEGTQILRPFLRMNFKVMAISPDFQFVFKDTKGAHWYNELIKGNVKKGEISLGQNLSNLVRLAILYKYGGIYMDTDFIILKSLNNLRNSIGAQTIDTKTNKWSRLNNALLIFDKKHSLLRMFIEEFVLTFNGNKWGHNGPYLVSRVVERLNGYMGLNEKLNFTILPPHAFYVVDWIRIGSLFRQPRDGNELDLHWINNKLKQIEEESYGIHLWNRESRGIKIRNGSVISHLMKKSCVFC
ncbi:hypothetical protein RND81_07G144800, partial [Saponaria officinalis]